MRRLPRNSVGMTNGRVLPAKQSARMASHPGCVTALLVLGTMLLHGVTFAAPAPRETVYKESRPMKKLFEGAAPPAPGALPEKGVGTAKYTYDPTGKTDPFKPFLAEQEAVEEQKKRKPRTYLETLDLSQLELIAVIVGPKGNWAMVRDSKGVGHVIQKGTPIGLNSGAVHTVSDREVVIREEYKDFRGNVQYKDIAKRLPSPE